MSECRCGKETRDDAYVCTQHIEELDQALGDVPWADEELEVSITRQKAAAIGGGARSSTTPLPWHEKASEARRNLRAVLVTWVRFCDEEQVRGRPATEPGDNLPAMSRWLLNATPGLALHELGMDAVEEITDALAECRRVVFWKKRARIYLGRCEQVVKDEDEEVITLSCEGDVYADEGEQVGTCVECGQGVTVVIRKADIDKRLADRLFTAAEAATAATYLGLHADRDRIRKRINQWHSRGRIVPARKEGDESWFRYSDLRPMLYAEFGDTA